MEKLDGKSMDIVEQNIEQLKELFPEVFSEGKIKFDQLQELLGNYVAADEDHYNFTWHGKRKAGRIAQTPSTGTLRPCKEESVDWDTTQNLFIEGDNLEVLKLLQKSYHRQVKMIYIDPPYNTGNEFIYPDKFQDNLDTYLKYTGQTDEEGYKLSPNTESTGRYHTNWLNMMYPRLKLARNLLRDDGVIFVSIGEEELTNLEKICNEIYGEQNHVTTICRVSKTASNLGTHFAASIDFILCYAKNIAELPAFSDEVNVDLYKKVEASGPRKGERYRDDVAFYQSSQKDIRPNQKYFIECPDGEKVIPPCSIQDEVMREGDGRWRWSKETYLQNKDFLVFKETKTSPLVNENGEKAKWNIYTKSYLSDRQEKGVLPRNYFDKFINRKGADLLKKYNIPFDFPKPVDLIQYLLSISNLKDEDIILDFFAGSSTTAHAVYDYNFQKRVLTKFIQVQLPEKTDEKSTAYKEGYRNIADISKERIRRAAKKIQEENPDYSGDLGFKVFKLDSSNIKRWEADFDTLEQDLLNAVDYIKQDRSSEDVLYELLLKYGLDLTVPIETRSIAGKTVYSIGLGALVVCLDKDITMDVVNGIGALKDELQPEIMRVVFKDDGFKDDVVKTNALQTLKRYGIEDIKSL